MKDPPFYPGATCYACGCGNAERRLYPTIDENIWLCGPCDSAMKRRKNFKPVEEGMSRLRELDEAETKPT